MIVKRGGGYHVTSESGKNLGGPYKFRRAARKRLRQVEFFKHQGKSASLSTWADSITRDCLLEAGDDVEAGLAALEYILSTQPVPDEVGLSTDQSGHEHGDAGSGHGGQFVGGKTISIEQAKERVKQGKSVFPQEKPPYDKSKLGISRQQKIDLPTKEISVSDIVTVQNTVNPAGVDYFLNGGKGPAVGEPMAPGSKFLNVGPWAVKTPDGKYYLEDGNTRGAALVLQGKNTIPLKVVEVDKDGRWVGASKPLSINALFAHDIHNKHAQRILNRSLVAAKGLSSSARKDLEVALKKSATGSGEAILNFIDKYRIMLAKILTSTQIASILSGAREVADKVPTLTQFPGAIPPPPTLEPQEAVKLIERLEELTPDKQAEEIYKLSAAEQVYVNQALAARAAQPPIPPTFPIVTSGGSGAPEDVHLPIIDEAVRNLAERNVMDRQSYDALEAAARAKAFTVANVAAEETLTKIRDSLAENVREGADYETWRKKVMEDVDQGTFMSDGHQEMVFRTNVQTGFSDGQASVLAHPLVRSGFPYVVYDSIHDDRVREDHREMDNLGIGGTNVYRTDDPVFQLFRPPWDYNCRCSWTPITVRHASEKGIKEAQEWLETGVEPTDKAFVPMPDFQPRPGFVRDVAGLPLSIQLSMQSLHLSHDVSSEKRDEGGEWTAGSSQRESDLSGGDKDKTKSTVAKLRAVATKLSALADRIPVLKTIKSRAQRLMKGIHRRLESRYGAKVASTIMVSGSLGGYGVMTGALMLTGTPGIPFVNDLVSIAAHTAVAEIGLQIVKLRKKLGGKSLSIDDKEWIKAQVARLRKQLRTAIAQMAKEHNREIGDSLSHSDTEAAAKEVVKAFKSSSAAMSLRLELTARILVNLFGDDAIDEADGLISTGDISLAVMNPVLKRRYGPRPGANWSPGGISANGKNIWLWSPPGAPSTPAPASTPTSVVAKPAPAPIPAPPLQTPPPKTFPFTPAPVPTNPTSSGGRAQANSISAYNAVMSKLSSGQQLGSNDKINISTKLTNMPIGLLRSLYTTLGGVNHLPNTKAAVASVKAILSGGQSPNIITAPTSSPTPSPVSTPSPIDVLPVRLQSSAAQVRAIALAVKDRLIKIGDAKNLVTSIFQGQMGNADRHAIVDALIPAGASVSNSKDLIAAIINKDPGHGVGVPSPPGPAPWVGLEWDATKHRWVKIKQAATPLPTPAQTSTPPPTKSGQVPDYYQPPPPKLPTDVAQYADAKSAKSAGIPLTIDHTVISGFDDQTAHPDYSPTINSSSNVFFELAHQPSGYKVLASWKHGAVGATSSGLEYTISVLDGTGKVVSTYDSQAPRNEMYVRGRSIQTANWLEGEIKRLASQKKSTIKAPLAQFAWDYANAAGVKAGTVPFDISFVSRSNYGKIEGYLKSEFPKLIGARQHSPHAGMDTIEHTMNIVNSANLRSIGLPARDAELLRLGMVFHDVGKQHDPLAHEHPRKSAKDSESHLWQFGLTPREVADTLAVIKWHDVYGDSMQGSISTREVAKIAYEYTDDSLSPDARKKEAHRINDLLMRAWQSDVSTIPGLTQKPIPGRPDLTARGFIDVDTAGPTFNAKVASEIDSMDSASRPVSLPLPKKPRTPKVGTSPQPDLVAPGLKWGEIVQRHEQIPVGGTVPYNSTKVPPKEVYDEAHKNPDLNYARAFNMGYDGPTGKIITVYHGTNPTAAAGILSTGIHAGKSGDNVFGHGVYTVVNGAKSVPSNYVSGAVAQMEVHTGKVIDHDDLRHRVIPAWTRTNPAEAKRLTTNRVHSSVEARYTAAALWAGYSTIAVDYGGSNPTLIILDPSRIRLKSMVDGNHNGITLKTTSGNVTSTTLSSSEKATPVGHVDWIPVKNGVPQGWSGNARIS